MQEWTTTTQIEKVSTLESRTKMSLRNPLMPNKSWESLKKRGLSLTIEMIITRS